MFLSRDSLPASSADWMEYHEKVHNNLVQQTRELKRTNYDLGNQIAEHKRVEEVLRQAEQKYRSIFENAIEGIFQTTPDGRYITCNPALARIYGYESAEELIATLTDIGQQLYVAPQRRQEFIKQMQACDWVCNFESQVYRKDGKIIWICENARAVRNANGTLLYYEGCITDITQRKLSEEALRQSEAQLKAKTEQLELALSKLEQTQAQLMHNEKIYNLGQLVAGVAHEINNPVNFVCGNLIPASQYVEDLLDLLRLYAKHYPQPIPEIQAKAEAIDLEFLIEDFPKALSSMQLGADRIRQIVQSLRNFSRLDESEMTPVDLHIGLDSTLLILNNRLKPKGDNSGITVIKDYGELPPVRGYAGLLNQVFMNLLCNAIDALEDCPPKSGVAMHLEARDRTFPPEGQKRSPAHNLEEQPAANETSSVNTTQSDCSPGMRSLQPNQHDVPTSTVANPPSLSPQATLSIDTPCACAHETLASPSDASPASGLESGRTSEDQFHPTHFSRIIRICTHVIHDDSEGTNPSKARAVVSIMDNGPGMSPEIMSQIFDPFFTTKPVGKGTGLGLSISYQIIVEKHRGQLQCISSPNQGTEFRIEIPIEQ
jgi:PAS domain S-box-containing protein